MNPFPEIETAVETHSRIPLDGSVGVINITNLADAYSVAKDNVMHGKWLNYEEFEAAHSCILTCANKANSNGDYDLTMALTFAYLTCYQAMYLLFGHSSIPPEEREVLFNEARHNTIKFVEYYRISINNSHIVLKNSAENQV